MTDQREDAVEHLSTLLKRDLLAVDDYRLLVDRVLQTTTDDELAAVLAPLPSVVPVRRAAVDDRPLVLRCTSGVMKEAPQRLARFTEIVCESGVMKVDLSLAALDDPEVELDIECDSGVLKVTMPRAVAVEVEEHTGRGGVFKSKLERVPVLPGVPRVYVRVRNGGGVIKLEHPRRWRWFGWLRR